MSGGGGGGGQQPQDNSLQIAQLQYQQQRESEQRAADQKIADTAKFNTDREAAFTGAQGTGRSALVSRGLNPDDYMDIVTRALTDTKARIPQGDPNPASYFTSDVTNNALTQEENTRRIRNTGVVNSEFSDGYDRTAIPDTWDDSYINEILGGQRENANKSLDYARSRGQLNDVGYNSALSKINEQETGARSTLDMLGGSVLAKNRSGLGDIKSSASSGANAYTLGSPEFKIDPYRQRLTDAVAGYQKNLKGDLTNALGGTQLFNVNDILLSGSRAQGPQNLTTASVPGALRKKDPSQDRGLGSTGTF